MPKDMLYSNVPDLGRGPSVPIWSDMDIVYAQNNPTSGWFVDDNFAQTFPIGIAATGVAGPYYTFFSSGATITAASKVGGGLTLTEATDNEGVSLQRRTLPFRFGTTGYGKLVAEFSLSVANISTANGGNLFVGLTDGTANTATVPITASAALADINCIGFLRVEGDMDALDIVYKADGQTAQTVLADAVTLVADTDVKLGIVYDPMAEPASRITFYKNGEAISGAAISATSVAAATFPNDVFMNTNYAILAGAGTSPVATFNWGRVIQKAV